MYMLDTNTVGYLFRQHPNVLEKLAKMRPLEICISSITEAELLYGVAKRKSKALTAAVQGFLETITVYAWDSEAAKCYGQLRAAMEQKGQVMGHLDQLIAAHALSRNATIITSDRAFTMVARLRVEDWTV